MLEQHEVIAIVVVVAFVIFLVWRIRKAHKPTSNAPASGIKYKPNTPPPGKYKQLDE